MFKLEYYIRPNGTQPVVDWLDRLDRQKYEVITAKMVKLKMVGLDLLKTEMLRSIKSVPGLYELKGGQCRVLVYYERGNGVFIVLQGFLKKKARETHEIDIGVRLLREYLTSK